jgi:pyrophosphatase PpaX
MLPALLFDLDGTLVDSIELILASARFAFQDFSGRAPTDDEWRASIGRPLVDAFRDFVPDEGEAQRLMLRFREYQVANHDRLMRPYDGVVEVIRGFAAAGHPMALVTSKSDLLAQRGLVHIRLDDAIPVVVGCDSCTRHKPHPEPVERALGMLDVSPGDAIFVGDSPHDVECGRGAGVFTVGVTWGAFSPAAMHRSGADAVIEEISQLPGLVESAAVARAARPRRSSPSR